MDIRFCYRISSDAQMAYNTETGDPADAFMQVQFGGAKKSFEDYAKQHQSIGQSLASQHGMNPEWITPISTDEYDRETEGDDDDEDIDYL